MTIPQVKRVKGVVHERGLIYGSLATPLSRAEKAADPNIPEGHTHRWSIYVRAPTHDPTLPVPYSHLSSFIKRVTFKLHASFAAPNRTFDAPPYEVNETGWGEFEIKVQVKFQDPQEKDIMLVHHLQLYSKGEGEVPGTLQRVTPMPWDDTSETSGGPEDPTSPTTPRSKPAEVQVEHYEEIVFQDPTPLMHSLLQSQPAPTVPAPTCLYDPSKVTSELALVESSKAKVLAEKAMVKAKLDKTNREIERLRLQLSTRVAPGPKSLMTQSQRKHIRRAETSTDDDDETDESFEDESDDG